MGIECGQLVGAWRLVDFRITFVDGREPVAPLGEAADGLIVYGADGWMSAVLSAPERSPLSAGSMELAAQADATEKAAAFDTYVSYCGRWSLEDDRVTHTVEMALVPNIVGREQIRRAKLENGALTLQYEVPGREGPRTYTLRWRRA